MLPAPNVTPLQMSPQLSNMLTVETVWDILGAAANEITGSSVEQLHCDEHTKS